MDITAGAFCEHEIKSLILLSIFHFQNYLFWYPAMMALLFLFPVTIFNRLLSISHLFSFTRDKVMLYFSCLVCSIIWKLVLLISPFEQVHGSKPGSAPQSHFLTTHLNKLCSLGRRHTISFTLFLLFHKNSAIPCGMFLWTCWIL